MPAIEKLLFPDGEDDDEYSDNGNDDKTACFAALRADASGQFIDRLYEEPQPDFECLLSGPLTPRAAHAAPYLVRLEAASAFTQWVLPHIGSGAGLGVIAVAPAPMALSALRRHFRRLGLIAMANGDKLIFRYFDPPVFRTIAPVFSVEQLRQLFGPVAYFIADSAIAGQILKFSRDRSGALQTEKISLES